MLLRRWESALDRDREAFYRRVAEFAAGRRGLVARPARQPVEVRKSNAAGSVSAGPAA